jgi:hypothetical protein
MSLKCDIIDQAALDINGGKGAYGGVATSFSFTFGGLNSGMRASLTITGKNLGNPAMGDALKISMLGGGFRMDVASYTRTKDSLSLNLVDISHRILDHAFVVLNDGFATTVKGIKPVGCIRTPDTTEMAGSTIHKPQTGFRKGKAGDSGKAAGMVTEDAFGADTLKDALKDIYSGPLSNGLMSYEGSLREVISKVAQDQGVLPYWDMLTSTVKTIDAGGMKGGGPEGSNGGGLIEDISKACAGDTTISETEDFTGTVTAIAMGSCQQNLNKDSEQESAGGKTTRYIGGTLLDPDFHIGTCGKAAADKIIDFEDEDVLKAITASTNDKVYGTYVIQSVLKNAANVAGGAVVPLAGKDGNGQVIDNRVAENFPAIIPPYPENKFLSDYYNGGVDLCRPHIHLSSPMGEGDIQRIEAKMREENANKAGFREELIDPADLPAVQPVDGVYKMMHKPPSFAGVLSPKGQVDASDDTLKAYLQALLKFKHRYYVVKGQLEGTPTYKGFLLTAEAASGAANFEAPNGYSKKPCNPYLSVAQCGIASIKELATMLSFIYRGDKQCSSEGEGHLDGIRTGDFIHAMMVNKLPDILTAGEASTEDAEETAERRDQGFQMYLFEKDSDDSKVPNWSSVSTTCEVAGMITTTNAKPDIIKIAESVKVTSGDAVEVIPPMVNGHDENGDAVAQEANDWFGINQLEISKKPIDDELVPFGLDHAPRKIKVWYDVKQMPASFCNPPKDEEGEDLDPGKRYASVSAGSAGKKAWKASLNKFSVSPSDVYTPPEDPEDDLDYESNLCQPSQTIDNFVWSKMKERLGSIVGVNAWVDLMTAKSQSITYTASSEGPTEIPNFSTGIESISISSNGGKTTVTINVGNARLREAIKVMRESIIKSVEKGGNSIGLPTDQLQGAPNTKFYNLWKGNG